MSITAQETQRTNNRKRMAARSAIKSKTKKLLASIKVLVVYISASVVMTAHHCATLSRVFEAIAHGRQSSVVRHCKHGSKSEVVIAL